MGTLVEGIGVFSVDQLARPLELAGDSLILLMWPTGVASGRTSESPSEEDLLENGCCSSTPMEPSESTERVSWSNTGLGPGPGPGARMGPGVVCCGRLTTTVGAVPSLDGGGTFSMVPGRGLSLPQLLVELYASNLFG